jgi:hypothetical protein
MRIINIGFGMNTTIKFQEGLEYYACQSPRSTPTDWQPLIKMISRAILHIVGYAHSDISLKKIEFHHFKETIEALTITAKFNSENSSNEIKTRHKKLDEETFKAAVRLTGLAVDFIRSAPKQMDLFKVDVLGDYKEEKNDFPKTFPHS